MTDDRRKRAIEAATNEYSSEHERDYIRFAVERMIDAYEHEMGERQLAGLSDQSSEGVTDEIAMQVLRVLYRRSLVLTDVRAALEAVWPQPRAGLSNQLPGDVTDQIRRTVMSVWHQKVTCTDEAVESIVAALEAVWPRPLLTKDEAQALIWWMGPRHNALKPFRDSLLSDLLESVRNKIEKLA